ncbi:Signal transducing adapter molecule 2 [Thelohanellus kitauei]|uniref:Signal transducing adapter molecule 2 n=1 Tax=Thelohanellus kitauei TaxID=669202 RepID=A0A0C2I5F0_THEKT|nr:Signal transducing adapter molecule 2 [Thelohanellus kitauei]
MLRNQLNEIISSSQDSDKIDTIKVCQILSSHSITQSDVRLAVSSMYSNMLNMPVKGLIALEMIQYMISMCMLDVLEQLSTSSLVSELHSVVKNSNNKPYRCDLLRFIQKIALENKNKEKYKRFVDLYGQLKLEGFPFPNEPSTTSKQPQISSNRSIDGNLDPQLQKALKLSLEDSKRETRNSAQPKAVKSHQKKPTLKSATVLYDFVAEEAGELSIKKGETVQLLEKPNESWWKGQIGQKVGLFPSNFVSETGPIDKIETYTPQNLVDENLLNQCLTKLIEADPICQNENEEELKQLEKSCTSIRPHVESQLKYLKEQEDEYSRLDQEYSRLIASYQRLIETSRLQNESTYSQPVQPTQPPPQPLPYSDWYQGSTNYPTTPHYMQPYPQYPDLNYQNYQSPPDKRHDL